MKFVILVTPAFNPMDCAPFKSEHSHELRNEERERFQQLCARAADARQRGAHAETLAALDEAASLGDRYANLHIERTLALHALQRYEPAKKAMLRAVDEDLCPLRAPSLVRETVADVATHNECIAARLCRHD